MNQPPNSVPDSSATADLAPGQTWNANGTIDQPATSPGTVDFVPPPPDATIDDATQAEPAAGPAKKVSRKEMPTVPGFEILGELGRGGMGVVYKARQLKLNRTVALKMVLSGAHASPEQLSRFNLEAQAVARLQHPHIVQIYEIGEHNDLPFFSLEFVDGGTLEKHIDRKPQPPRHAAEVVETLARTMQFAHEQNIVHRDLKPANILLVGGKSPAPGLSLSGESKGQKTEITSRSAIFRASDHQAINPKITDFGLAKAVEEGATQATQSGTIMGTPSYMAPEQARGDIKLIGPRCDQYSLGAILYELLTGRPPFQGATILDTLDQVRTREPVPPTQLQPKVPVDLETICLKSLQKDPPKRYDSCADMADDLGRFLRGEPILARPVSARERAWRWCKRNPWIAGLTALAALLLICVAAGSLWTAIKLSHKNATIVTEKEAAQKSAAEAEAARIVADRNADEAKAARKLADQNAAEATDQSRIALTTIQVLISKVQAQLDQAPGTQQLKEDLLKTALEGVKLVSLKAEGTTSIEPTRMAALMKLGELYKQLGESEKAMAKFQEVHEVAKARVVLKKGTDASRSNLAATLVNLANMHKELRRDMRAALTHTKEALAIWEDIDRNPKAGEDGLGGMPKPIVIGAMAEMNTLVGVNHLHVGEPAQALPYFRKSLEYRREQAAAAKPNEQVLTRLTLAKAVLAIGETSVRLGDQATASASFQESVAAVEELVRQNDKILVLKMEMERIYALAGDYQLRIGEPVKARRFYEQSLPLVLDLAKQDPKKFEYQWDLGMLYYRLGLQAVRVKDAAAAKANFLKCRAIREPLATQDKANDRRQMELMLALAHCGDHIRAAAIAAGLERGPRADSELLVDVTRTYAQCALAAAASADLKTRYTNEAVRVLRRAIEMGYRDESYLKTAVDLDPLRDVAEFARVLDTFQTEVSKPAK